LNLVKNAIDAMSSLPPKARRLRITTRVDDHSTMLLSGHWTRNSCRGSGSALRSVLYNKVRRHGNGTRCLSYDRRKPRRQIATHQVGRRGIHF
jgi:hypothetical protein